MVAPSIASGKRCANARTDSAGAPDILRCDSLRLQASKTRAARLGRMAVTAAALLSRRRSDGVGSKKMQAQFPANVKTGLRREKHGVLIHEIDFPSRTLGIDAATNRSSQRLASVDRKSTRLNSSH